MAQEQHKSFQKPLFSVDSPESPVQTYSRPYNFEIQVFPGNLSFLTSLEKEGLLYEYVIHLNYTNLLSAGPA